MGFFSRLKQPTSPMRPVPGIAPVRDLAELKQLEQALRNEKTDHQETKDQLKESGINSATASMLDLAPEGVQLIRVKPAKTGNRYAACFQGGYRVYGVTGVEALSKLFKAKPNLGKKYQANLAAKLKENGTA